MHANAGGNGSFAHLNGHQQSETTPSAEPSRFASAITGCSRIVVLHAERFQRELIRKLLQPVFTAAIVTLASSIADATEALRENACDILITDIVATDGSTLDALASWTKGAAKRVYVVTAHREPAILEALSQTRIHGIIDCASADLDAFVAAVDGSNPQTGFWSPTLLPILRAECFRHDAVLCALSLKDRLVLSVIGDGSDDEHAAAQLEMPALTVKTVRQRLHRALNVQHRGELIQRATELGLVLWTSRGVIRPLYNRLRADYLAKCHERLARRDAAA